jgi:predicted ferric reductase
MRIAGARPSARRGSGRLRVAIVAGSVISVAMWWVGTPSTSPLTPAATATALGELAGMVGAFLICAQVLLIARVPWFERAVGLDRLVSWHRTLGSTVLFLVISHVLLMILGIQLLTSSTPWAATATVLTSYPDMLAALIGTLLFFAVGYSSARIPRAKITYEIWYWLHLTSYLAIFLTFFHELSAGIAFIRNPFNRVLWIALYLATASALLTWRFILPTLSAFRFRMRVTRVVDEGPGVHSVWLEGPHLSELHVVAGQFMMFRFASAGHFGSAHPFSLSRLPRDGTMRITVGALGDHTTLMRRLKPGTIVFAEGPFGHFTPDASHRRKVLLIAGGAGIGPILALAKSFVVEGRDVVTIYRSSVHGPAPLEHELRNLQPMSLHVVVGSRRSLGYDPLEPRRIRRAVKDILEREVYICGPEAMGLTAERSLSELGLSRSLIHREVLSLG